MGEECRAYGAPSDCGPHSQRSRAGLISPTPTALVEFSWPLEMYRQAGAGGAAEFSPGRKAWDFSASVEILPEMAQPDDAGRCTGFENKAEASFRTPKILMGSAQINRVSVEPTHLINPLCRSRF